MMSKKKLSSLKVIGDRVLLLPDNDQARTGAGLYLPPTVIEKESVRGGYVVAVGPGTPLANPDADGEPWQQDERKPRYLPMEVEVGDYALFVKKAAIEITYRDTRYMIVPLAGILLVERDPGNIDLNKLLEDAKS